MTFRRTVSGGGGGEAVTDHGALTGLADDDHPYVLETLIDAADDLIVGTAADTAGRLAVAASRIVGKKATGGLAALTAAEAVAVLGVNGGWYLKDYATATRASTSLTLNQTAITDVDTGLDLVLDAATGDIVEYGISGVANAVAQIVGFDVYTVVSASPVNPFGPGLSSSLGSTAGASGWYTPAVAQEYPISGSHHRTLVAGDISAGTVTLRLRYAKPTSTARTLFATANNPLTVAAKVWAPFPT